MITIGSILVDTLSYGMVLFIISIGLSITLGLMRLVNLAHCGFAMVGGYFASYAIELMGIPYGFAVLLAVIGVVVLSIPVERVLFRPLYGKSDHLLQVLITIGIAFCMIGLTNYFFGPTLKKIPLPPMLSGPVDIGFRFIPAHRILVVLSGLLIFAGLWFLVEKTRFGVRLRAAVDNANIAASLGIKTQRIYTITFVISVALGAFGGVVGAELLPIEPHYALRYMVVIFVVVCIGGAGSIGGALAASLLIGFIDTASKYLFAGYADIFLYASVIAIVMLFPHGLLGRKVHVPSNTVTAAASIDPPRRSIAFAGSIAIGLAGLCAYFIWPDYSGYFSRVVSLALLVISLDLLVGYCGIATLGQAALYGIGAYATGIVALKMGHADPFFLLGVGLAAGGVAGLISGAIIVRASGLAQLVMTVAIVQLVLAIANKLTWLTGGSDGLAGITPGKLFGVFEFDFAGELGYLMGLGVLVVVLLVVTVIVNSPFGLLCRGIKGDPVRVAALGGNVNRTLIKMFVISGMVAGLGGSLAAITSGVVGLDSLSFERSAEAFIMLILGGSGTIFGAVAGVISYLVAEHLISAVNPFHWLIAIGAILVAVMYFLPTGLQGLFSELRRRFSKTSSAMAGGVK